MKFNFLRVMVLFLICAFFNMQANAQRGQTNPDSELKSDLQKVSTDAKLAYKNGKLKEREYQKLVKEFDNISFSIDKSKVDGIVTPREKEAISMRIIKIKDKLVKYQHANGFY